MKNLIILFCVAILAVLQSCKTPQNTNTSKENPDELGNLEKKWKLIELNGTPVASESGKKSAFLELDLSKNTVSGNDGCNSFSGEVKAAQNYRINFSKIASTEMLCQNVTIGESFLKALEIADNYTLSNGVLSLNKARMAPLARFEEMKDNPLEGEWELDYISGQRIAFGGLYPDKKPTIRFEADQTEATGHSSCNGYGVKFEVNGNAIKFGDPRATMMACEGGGEQAFFKTLKTISQYSVNENTLNLIMGDIAVMRFQRKK